MSDWQDKLPPRMRERLAEAGELTPDERQKLKAAEELNTVLSGFYKGDLDSDGLWNRLKQFKEQGRTTFLKDAQMQLIDSLTINSAGPELQRRKAAIVAVETLKSQPNTAALEQSLNAIEALQARKKKEMQQGYDYLKAEIERNPQLRVQQVKQGDQTVVVQLTVEEAVKLRPEWKNFLTQHEAAFAEEFGKVMDRIRKQAK